MATYTFVDFERPEAADLARLTSIRYDLTGTIALCDYLLAQIDSAPNGWPAPEVTDAFSTAIVVRYNRAFVTGARHGLRNEELAILGTKNSVLRTTVSGICGTSTLPIR